MMFDLIHRIKSRFLYKMFFLFTAIVFVIFTAVALIITNLVSSVLLERDNRYNQFVLVNINNHMQQRFDNIHQLVMLTNSQELQQNDLVSRFLQNPAESSGDYVGNYNGFTRYIYSLFSFDSDISGIEVYKNVDARIFKFTRNQTGISVADPSRNKDVIDLSKLSTQNIVVSPATYDNEIQRYAYVLSTNLKTLTVYNNVAVLSFRMDTTGLAKLIDGYYQKAYGEIYVVTEDNHILFSSSGNYYGQSFPIPRDKLSLGKAMLDGKQMTVNSYSKNEARLAVIQLIPKGLGNESIFTINTIVVVALFLSVFIAAIFSFSISRLFSKRIMLVTDYFARVQAGDLSGRIPLDKSGDEITLISRSFNRMCENLQKYIENEYILELNKKEFEVRLKNTEIKTLQAQINPHFMYNTLEMIRMRANKDGSRSAGEMILVLSKLLRNSIKETILVTIDEEIKTARLFIKLYEMKYDNLSVEFDVDKTLYRYAIIRNTIQPVLENSIVHGYRDNGIFRINVSVKMNVNDTDIIITISDNGNGIARDELQNIASSLEKSHDGMPSHAHIGLANVNDRLRLFFGDSGRIMVSSISGEGTVVAIRFPAKTTEEMEGHV
jgi:two-component system sensor histidine kinase YesM